MLKNISRFTLIGFLSIASCASNRSIVLEKYDREYHFPEIMLEEAFDFKRGIRNVLLGYKYTLIDDINTRDNINSETWNRADLISENETIIKTWIITGDFSFLEDDLAIFLEHIVKYEYSGKTIAKEDVPVNYITYCREFHEISNAVSSLFNELTNEDEE